MTVDKFFIATKKISSTFLFSIFIAFLVFFTGCNKDDDGFSTDGISEIAGVWTASRATFNGTDVINEGGEVKLTIQENGKFTFTIQRPDKNKLVFTGKLGFDEEWLAVEYSTNPGEFEYYDIAYDANNLHIGANSEFDFDDDGVDEFVIFFLDMIR